MGRNFCDSSTLIIREIFANTWRTIGYTCTQKHTMQLIKLRALSSNLHHHRYIRGGTSQLFYSLCFLSVQIEDIRIVVTT